jgi:hypothetical protein
MIDQSPVIDKLALWRVIERASALQLSELAHEMVCAMREVPQLAEMRQADMITQAELADAMAIAFEAGRNYAASELLIRCEKCGRAATAFWGVADSCVCIDCPSPATGDTDQKAIDE